MWGHPFRNLPPAGRPVPIGPLAPLVSRGQPEPIRRALWVTWGRRGSGSSAACSSRRGVGLTENEGGAGALEGS